MCSQRPPDTALDGIEGNSDILKLLVETFKPSFLVNGLDNHWPTRSAHLTCDTIQAIGDYPSVSYLALEQPAEVSIYEKVVSETKYLSHCRGLMRQVTM